MKRIIIALIMLIGGLCFRTVPVIAEEGFEDMDVVMTVSPPQQKIVLVPGEVYEGAIRVSNSNNAKTNLKYSVTIGSLSYAKDEDGNTDFNDTDVDTVTEYNQMMKWITLGKTKGTVAPNTIDTIPFTITVPVDAPGGGQYATIIVQDDTYQDNQENGNVSIQNVLRFASGIFAEVAGETRNEGEIIENSVPTIIFSNKLSAISKVRNDGNVHANAKYTLQVWPLFSGEEICTNEEKPSESLIMPGTDRVHAEECSLPVIGIFRAKQVVEIFGERSEVEKIVVVCPLWLLFIIIFGVALFIAWSVAKAKNRKREA